MFMKSIKKQNREKIMTAIISKVTKVEAHPNPEKSHLGVFTLDDQFQLIGINNEDGSRRFKVNDLVVHVRPGSIIPQWLIDSGFENLKGGKVKASNFAGVRSEGIMLNTVISVDDPSLVTVHSKFRGMDIDLDAQLGEDVSWHLQIKEY